MSALPAIETAALGRTTIYVGDCRETLKRLPEQSVHCVITSPPYYGLRSYGVEPGVWGGDGACDHEWGDSERGAWANEVSGPSANVGKNGASRSRPKDAGQFCVKCGAWRGCLGLEPDVDLFLANMVDVFREVWRVLRDDGTLWLDIGDSYSGSGKGPTGQNGVGQHERRQGFDTDCRSASIPAKNLMLIPWRLLIALQADGWIVRSIISWQKAAPMPESVTDRPTSAWEPIFLLTKRGRYFYDAEAVREPNKTEGNLRDKASEAWGQSARLTPTGKGEREWNNPAGRNMWNYWRDLDDAWLLSPEPFSDAHFATFPTEIPRRAILAGTSAKGVCPQCGAPWRRVMEVTRENGRNANYSLKASAGAMSGGIGEVLASTTRHSAGWQPSCRCNAGEPIPATVLDPFGGAGTTALAANRNGRNAILCELSPAYADMARRRLMSDMGMLADCSVI